MRQLDQWVGGATTAFRGSTKVEGYKTSSKLIRRTRVNVWGGNHEFNGLRQQSGQQHHANGIFLAHSTTWIAAVSSLTCRRCWRCVVPLSLPSIVRQRIHLTSQFFLVHSHSACRCAPSSIVVAWSRCLPPSPLPREQLPSSGRPPGGCLPSGRRSLLQRGGLGPCGRGGGASA